MINATRSPSDFQDEDFYDLETRREEIEFLIRYAILAPSGHNTQPWRFTITEDGIEISADESRRLPRLDPFDREMLMSLGAAITNLRVAAAHFGFQPTVLLFTSGLLVAKVTLRETSAPDVKLGSLFPAIKRRHTNRTPFRREAPDPDALQRVLDLVHEHHDTFRLIVPQELQRAADLIAYADREQMADPRVREELALWLRESGINGLGYRILAGLPPFIVRHWDPGNRQAHYDRDLAMSSSFMIVVCAHDDRTSLLEAGQALEIMLLTITDAGLQYSFLNSPIQQAGLRDRVAMLAGSRVPPQLLIRLGSGRPAQPSARRPFEAVVQ